MVRRFHDLMPYRVREVLLVSSPYDAFILEEDGLLTEQVFREYRGLSLSAPPRFTHVPSGEEAMHCLHERRYDLILVMTSLADMSVNAFGRRVKDLRPGRPVVLLALDRKELHQLDDSIDPQAIDGTFLWSGDAQILLAIIKYTEDCDNVEHDISHGKVRVIIVIEDSPRFYSSFLGMLYKELMKQSHSLYREGANELRRQMYMKSRPKILHATSYEQGEELFRRYRRNVIAIISDVRIPHGGKLDPEAGLEFARLAREADPNLPLLLHSAEGANAAKAAAMDAVFVDKKSPRLLAGIRAFLMEKLGFSDFVFRLPSGQEIGRARDLQELEKKLESVPGESLQYHASQNHFSMWLMARSEFDLAEDLRPRRLSDFPSIEAMRQHLLQVLQETHRIIHRGVISDYNRQHFDHELFSRLGHGALGGKARGIAFLNHSVAGRKVSEFGGLPVKFPKTAVITTEYFDAFIENNELQDFAYTCEDDEEIAGRFVDCPFPDGLRQDLRYLIVKMREPLAIRSSSLLEDSLHQPFAGIYTTLMITNNSSNPKVRLDELCAAIKLVFASTFYCNAKSYLASTGNRVEEEKMAVIIQELVGRQHEQRFYPNFSGVAQSHNFYPLKRQKPEEGVVHAALGLGRFVVDGGAAVRFNPRFPGIPPPARSEKALLDTTQRGFYALDMERPCCDLSADLFSTVRYYDLSDAEADGTLSLVGSVYCPEDRQIREDLGLQGPRVVTFNNILKHKAIPLPSAISRVLDIAHQGLGRAVEVEFACDMGDYGQAAKRGKKREQPVLYILQVRPFGAITDGNDVRLSFNRDDSLCSSVNSLGNGVLEDVRNIVYVCPDRWDASYNKAIALEVAEMNEALGSEDQPYVLIGPGRWGTADEWLGIPVQWSQISNVKVIVEASPEGYNVEPSQGTHFFQNMTSLNIGYLTLPPGADKGNSTHEEYLDWAWLGSQTAHRETEHLRLLRLREPLTVVLNGRKGRGMIAKPGTVAG
ncbi:MAG: histidine kinase [bacterium]|nr:histidine kinase [bacterium]